jgi:hypothetical protein
MQLPEKYKENFDVLSDVLRREVSSRGDRTRELKMHHDADATKNSC